MKEFDHNTDALLKSCLKSDDQPDERLNETLKRKLFEQSQSQSFAQRSVSLWWLPMLLSVLMSGMVSTFSFLFISTPSLQTAIILISSLTGTMSVLLTIIGVKCFGLKKGALVAL